VYVSLLDSFLHPYFYCFFCADGQFLWYLQGNRSPSPPYNVRAQRDSPAKSSSGAAAVTASVTANAGITGMSTISNVAAAKSSAYGTGSPSKLKANRSAVATSGNRGTKKLTAASEFDVS
jgi:hypothetical protein